MTDTNKIISGLNGLLEKNYDAEAGYKNAIENTDSIRLKSHFNAKINQRNRFGHQIKDEIHRLGGTPNKGGSVAGTLHRAWMDITAALSLNNEEAVLDACETGESAALEDYDNFLDKNMLPHQTRTLIANQRMKIAKSKRLVEHLEEQLD